MFSPDNPVKSMKCRQFHVKQRTFQAGSALFHVNHRASERLSLLSNTELRENDVEQVLDIDCARDAADLIRGTAQILRTQFKTASILPQGTRQTPTPPPAATQHAEVATGECLPPFPQPVRPGRQSDQADRRDPLPRSRTRQAQRLHAVSTAYPQADRTSSPPSSTCEFRSSGDISARQSRVIDQQHEIRRLRTV